MFQRHSKALKVFLVLFLGVSFTESLPTSSSSSGLSNKGRKFAESNQKNNFSQWQEDKPVKTQEDLFSTGSSSNSKDEWGGSSGNPDDDWGSFGSFGDDSDGFGDDTNNDSLPPCDLVQSPDTPCKNVTVIPEVRYPDPVMSRLISQVWSDFQNKLNNEAALYGMVIDPLDIDSRLPEPIDLKQSGSGFNVDVKMSGIKVYGLSGIRLDESSVTRSENLTDVKIKVVFAFDSLVINGSYSLKGQFGWWELDSQGQQLFAISMVNATLTYQMKMEVVAGGNDWNWCSNTNPDNVLITEIRLPLEYADVNFKFENLGSFANTMVNTVGIYFLKTQEETIVGEIRKQIKKNVNSLIC